MTDLAQELHEGWCQSLLERGKEQPKPWAQTTSGNRAPWFSFAEAIRGNQARETD